MSTASDGKIPVAFNDCDSGRPSRTCSEVVASAVLINTVPLDLPADARCDGRVQVQLDLAALPTPLRFPAFFEPEQWQLASPSFAWSAP